MIIYKLKNKDGLLFTEAYREMHFSSCVAESRGLKRFIVKLRRLLLDCPVFLIAVNSDGGVDSAFLLSMGYPWNWELNKEIFSAALLSNSTNFLLIGFDCKDEISGVGAEMKNLFKMLGLNLLNCFSVHDDVARAVV